MEEETIEEEVEEEVNEDEAIKAELAEALETIETLRQDLQEVNLLNSKLLYVNKIFKANNLTESQKVNVIAAFDKAETVKEVKLVFETVSENVAAPKVTRLALKWRWLLSRWAHQYWNVTTQTRAIAKGPTLSIQWTLRSYGF